MLYYGKGGSDYAFSHEELREAVFATLDKLGLRRKVLVIPPDFTRFFCGGRDNLSVASHLIHGTSEGRFAITYAPGTPYLPGGIRCAFRLYRPG